MPEPNHQLRTARGTWSQTQLAEAANAAITHATGAEGALTAKYISDLERGRYTWPNKHTRDALCKVLRTHHPADLGFISRRPQTSTAQVAATPHSSLRLVPVDDFTVDRLTQQTDNLRRLDRQLGARVLQQEMAAHVHTLDVLLSTTASLHMRRNVASVLADAAALAGWQSVDSGSLDDAWKHYELARRAAIESGSAELLTHAMGEQAYALVEAGHVGDAATLVSAAREDDQRLPWLLRSWLAAAHAEILAIAGDNAASLPALQAAEQLLPGTPDADLPYLSLDQFHLARWRGNILSRLGDSHGIESSLSALTSMDTSFVRARAGLHTDLAEGYMQRGDAGNAQVHVAQANHLAQQVGSLRLTRRITRIDAALGIGQSRQNTQDTN